MDISLIFSFCITSLLIELTPGPNMAYLAILTSQRGKKPAYFAILGIGCGLFAIGALVAFGLAEIIQQSHVVYQFIRWLGVAYLSWLVYEAWCDKDFEAKSHSNNQYQKYFARGLITNLLNPKAVLFYLAILPRFISSEEHAIVQMLVLITVYVGIATLIHLLVVGLSHQANKFLHTKVKRQLFSRVLAVLLAFVVVWFILTTATIDW